MTYAMSIDGEQQGGEGAFDVINPACEQVFAQAPACSAAQLEAAVSAAKRALASWRVDVDARRQALIRGAELLKERASEIGTTLTLGTVWVNQHLALSPYAPFGGAKCSGIGEAGGRWGLLSFMQKQVINRRLA